MKIVYEVPKDLEEDIREFMETGDTSAVFECLDYADVDLELVEDE